MKHSAVRLVCTASTKAMCSPYQQNRDSNADSNTSDDWLPPSVTDTLADRQLQTLPCLARIAAEEVTGSIPSTANGSTRQNGELLGPPAQRPADYRPFIRHHRHAVGARRGDAENP